MKIANKFGFAGWVDWSTPVHARAETVLDQLTVDCVQSSQIRAVPHCALAVWGAPAARPLVDTSDELTVLVCGRVQWQHTEHREHAARAGAAAVVAALYRAGGIAQVLSTLHGHFALVLCDERTREVTLVTDRLGIEPVCFARVGDAFVFARSVDSLARYPGFQSRVSAQALYDYLYSHMVPSPGTILEGVTKLEPAQSILWRNGKLEARRYWNPNFAPRRANGSAPSDAELVDTLDAAVADAAQPRCGAFLSGGIDSSTVTGLLARHTSGRAQAFSIGFDAQGFDESYYARLAAEHFGAERHEFRVTPRDIAQHLPEVICAIDEPFGNSSVIATYACAKFAAEAGMERLLAGDGGDELFGGNSRYAKQRVFELYGQVPGPLRTGVIEPLVRGAWADSVWPIRKLKSYVKQANVPLPDRLQSYAYLERLGPQHMLHPDFLSRVDVSLPLRQLRARYEETQADDVVDKMLYLDWKFTLADNDLRKVGRACELANVEVEYPWLDDRVVALSLRVPGQHKVNGTQLRYYAKRALSGFLPTETIHKKKHGFGLPFGVWMRDHAELRTLVEGALADFRRRDILRPGFIDEVLVMQRDVHASYYGELIWVLVCLELWLASRGH